MADRMSSKYFSQQCDLSCVKYEQRSVPEVPVMLCDISNSQKPRYATLHPTSNYYCGPSLQSQSGPQHVNFSRQRYMPYYNRSCSNNYSNKSLQYLPPPPGLNTTNNTSSDSGISSLSQESDVNNTGNISFNGNTSNHRDSAPDMTVTLQISNLDSTIDDRVLKQYLVAKLKPITPILSFVFEGMAVAKIRLPSQHHAKQVVSYLHRKKVGHKRITVSYTRESSSMEPSTLRCQVAGLLKDIPFYKLSMYKFRELFQSRFKTSISVMDLYDMKDICIISENTNEDKYISLRPELIHSIESSELMDCLQHSVPYCTVHFKKGHRGWAEQEIEPLPNVFMTVPQVRSIIYALLKNHTEDIPIASLVYCVQGELNIKIQKNENGVNLEHLISCVNGVQITTNKFGIKILSWLETDSKVNNKESSEEVSTTRYSKFGNDPFCQISREIIELVKMSPKATLKFSRFIPAYHNHFGKQCRVADYGYTKLIELFEALTSVVQIMGDGENRQITLTHKCQIRRFTSDLMRILRTQVNKSVHFGHLPMLFSSTQAKKFDITDYGVCDMDDILETLLNNNVVVVEAMSNPHDVVISIPKRKQSRVEVQKTSIFAGEVVELFRNASQYTIPFEKFACSYHYHFGYQCRLSDYGYLKLADLMEAITGIVEIEFSNEEDRKVYLSPKVAQRIFAEQLKDLIKAITGSSNTLISLFEILICHKKQFGYQIQPQSLGFENLWHAIKKLPYIELIISNENYFIICHHEDTHFRFRSYAACRIILESGKRGIPLVEFRNTYFAQFNEYLNELSIESMNHAIEIQVDNGIQLVTISEMMLFLIRIIGVLENVNVVSLSKLKTILNINVGDCFSFGYANLSSLLQAFPDIFTTSPQPNGSINDYSEIMINKECILAKNCVQQYLSVPSGSKMTYRNQPIQPIIQQTNIPQQNIASNVQPYCMENQNNYIPMNTEKMANNAISNHMNTNKENIYFLDDPLFSAVSQTIDPSIHHAKLYERKSSKNIASLDDFESVTYNTMCTKRLLSLYFDPPKPDTPSINPAPFWMDPIWSNNSASPIIESVRYTHYYGQTGKK